MRYLSDEASASIDRILSAKTENFVELARIAGLAPARDFHHAHLRRIDFAGCDLSGFDFTNTVFETCKFGGAHLRGSILAGTEFRDCDPSIASDWSLLDREFVLEGAARADGLAIGESETALSPSSSESVPDLCELAPRIVVFGIGNAGSNAITNMVNAGAKGVKFVSANIDAQKLNLSHGEKILLGPRATRGLSTGARPDIGRAAAEESAAIIGDSLEGADICFIAAGMGGGTGSGAAPVVARIARELGILTVAIVTKPFAFEGKRRCDAADVGVDALRPLVDTLIVIPNQNLFLIANAQTTFKEAFLIADETLHQAVRCITDLLITPGLINVDFGDIRAVMKEMGEAAIGTGIGEGQDRAVIAAQKAIANPLLDGISMNGATGVIVSITGGEDMRLLEVDEAANHVRELVSPEANIIWGSSFDPELTNQMRVTIIATGIPKPKPLESPLKFGGRPGEGEA